MKKIALFAVVWAFLFTLSFFPPAPAASCSETQVRIGTVDRDSDGLRYEDIEKKVKELIDELEKLQKEASQKLRKEVIPLLEREIDRLKEWLRDFRLNRKNEPRYRET